MKSPELYPDQPQSAVLTVPHVGETFDSQSIYLSGHSFEKCTFRNCTLIVKEFTKLGSFKDCSFSDCVWHLNLTVHNYESWQMFLKQIGPAISQTLPRGS